MAEQWRLVSDAVDHGEPQPAEYEPTGEPDDSELDEIPWGLGDEDEWADAMDGGEDWPPEEEGEGK